MKIYFFNVGEQLVLAKAKNLALARKKVRAKYPPPIHVHYWMDIDARNYLK